MDENEEYIQKNHDYIKQSYSQLNSSSHLFFVNITVLILYAVLIFSVFMQFIPIHNSNWFNLGMGKYVGIAAIFGIYCILTKNYFAAFFISLFSSFFVFHEVIIFYDNYAIELGKELGSDGTYRLVFEIFSNAFNIKYGAFWAVFGSLLSFISVTYAWITNTIIQNRLLLNKATD